MCVCIARSRITSIIMCTVFWCSTDHPQRRLVSHRLAVKRRKRCTIHFTPGLCEDFGTIDIAHTV